MEATLSVPHKISRSCLTSSSNHHLRVPLQIFAPHRTSPGNSSQNVVLTLEGISQESEDASEEDRGKREADL